MRRSGLIARLERYIRLTDDERDAIDAAERREARVDAGDVLIEEGGDCDRLFVIHTGWFHASRRLETGGRQILRFHFPGDLVGTSSIAWAQAVHTLTAVSDCIVSEMPKTDLGRLFREHPRLAGLLYAMLSAENVALSDRLVSVGRMDGVARLSFLFLDMIARQRATLGGVVDSFDMPLTQTDLGDAVGMTKVHVSRMLRQMQLDGLVERHGRRIKLLDEARMIAATGFVDRYHEIETTWLSTPPRAANGSSSTQPPA